MSTSPQLRSFALFGLPAQFELDDEALTLRYKDALMKVHPDKFAAKSATERRMAAEWSVNIQTAYDELIDPVKRASLLCEANGVPIDAETNTAMPGFFLMRQMERHEALDDAGRNVQKLQKILDEERELFESEKEALRQAIDVNHDWEKAKEKVRVLMFLRKFMKLANERLQQAQLEG